MPANEHGIWLRHRRGTVRRRDLMAKPIYRFEYDVERYARDHVIAYAIRGEHH